MPMSDKVEPRRDFIAKSPIDECTATRQSHV